VGKTPLRRATYSEGERVTTVIGVVSGVITGLAMAGLAACVWVLQRQGYQVVQDVPDFVPAAWVQIEAGR
jgi:hypothetical protein